MAIQRTDIGVSPLPTTLKVQTPDGEINPVYDRNAMTDAHTSRMYSTGMSYYLSCVMLGWDVMDNGEPWQPHDVSDVAHWQGVIRAVREEAHTAWVALKSQHDALTPDAVIKALEAGTLAPLGTEPTAIDAPITAQDRRNAYNSAWYDILIQLSPDFRAALFDGINDDFLGARWRTKTTGRTSQPKAATGTSPGSSSTPAAA